MSAPVAISTLLARTSTMSHGPWSRSAETHERLTSFRSVTIGWLAAALPIGGALQACRTMPPPSVMETVDSRAVALQTMGFVRSEEGWELSPGATLLFETDRDVLSESGRVSIDEVSRSLSQMGIDRIRVEGDTDHVGSAACNQSLSLRRARSVASEFVKNGWSAADIERHGYGFDKPVADNSTAEGRAQNRRVVIMLPTEAENFWVSLTPAVWDTTGAVAQINASTIPAVGVVLQAY